MKKRRRYRLLGLLALAIIVAGAARLSCFRGWPAPVRIAGGSMVEAYIGAYLHLDCGDCRFPIRFDPVALPTDEVVVCPNCGFAGNQVAAAEKRPGERVWLDSLPVLTESLRRWDVVAFETPENPEMLSVKRIVGMPGERLAIRDGELYEGGRLVRKSLNELRHLAILVHDDRYRSVELPPRWRPATDESNWRSAAVGYEVVKPEGVFPGRVDWLIYHHRRSSAGHGRRESSEVLDNYGFNQGQSRTLFPCTDLLVQARVTFETVAGEIRFSVHDGNESVQIRWQPDDGQLRLSRGGQLLTNRLILRASQDRPYIVEYSVCDRQVSFSIDGRLLIEFPLSEEGAGGRPISEPIGIGVVDLDARLEALRVLRDLYYLDPHRLGEDWTADGPTGQGEYLVLGDNSPISTDSRHWSSPALSRKSITGRVLRRGY